MEHPISGFSARIYGEWILETTKTGEVYTRFQFGTRRDTPVVGDWNGDEHGYRDFPAIYRELVSELRCNRYRGSVIPIRNIRRYPCCWILDLSKKESMNFLFFYLCFRETYSGNILRDSDHCSVTEFSATDGISALKGVPYITSIGKR